VQETVALQESRELDGERMRRKLFIVDDKGIRVNLD